jgi:WD40 repeat protein
VGTNAKGAIGAHADKDAEAQLFIWDKDAREVVFQITPVPGAKEVWDLSVLPNGQVIGSADDTLFLFDPVTREIVRTVTPFDGGIRALETNDGPWGYANTEKELFRFSPDLRTIELIDERDGYWRALLLTSQGRLFAGIAGELHEVELPEGSGR